MNDEFNRVEDSFFLHTDEEMKIVPSNLSRTLIVDCDDIHLRHSSLDLNINIPNEKIECLDSIVINGVKFIKEE